MISVWKLNALMEKHGISRIEQYGSDDAREVVLRAHYSCGEIREARLSPGCANWRDIKFLPTKKLEEK
jgi:hypothetical protein